MSTVKSSQLAAKKIFIVEDHPAFREGLVQIINTEEGLSVCGEAGDAETALIEIPRVKPDLVLVDITLPGKSGLELIREIRSVNQTIKLLVVSMHDESVYANRVLRAGGDGYIMKQEDPSELVNAIHDVLDGHIYVSEEVMASGILSSAPPKKSADPIDQLSDSELEILEMLGRGKANEEIAANLDLELSVVKNGCTALKNKLNLKSDNALIRYAVCWVENDGSDS